MGARGPAQAASTIPPFSVWPCGTPFGNGGWGSIEEPPYVDECFLLRRVWVWCLNFDTILNERLGPTQPWLLTVSVSITSLCVDGSE
jgi:hypothetical protein